MGSTLRVRRVRLDAADPPHLWEFPDGVTVIVGAVGGGKTSLLNLVQFGLGGEAPITDEIKQVSNSVTLDVVAGDQKLQLTRRFGENRVLVAHDDEPQRRYALTRSAKDPLLSDRLLEAFGIPIVQVRQSRTGASNKLTSISFVDVFAYCYLDQDEVDRSTVFDTHPFRGPKRATTFELLYRIIDEEIAGLEVQRLKLQEARQTRTARIDAVEAFANEKGLSITSEAIDTRLRQIADQEQALVRQLDEARLEAKHAVRVASDHEEEAGRIEQRLLLAHEEQARTTAELDGIRRAANQLERDLATLRDGEVVRSVLSPLPYIACPRCEQPLDSRPHPDGHCAVCLQPDPPRPDDDEHERRLIAQLEETRSLETQLVAARDANAGVVTQLTKQLRDHRTSVSRAVAAATAPHLAAATRLQEELGALKGERTALAEAQPVTKAIETERHELGAIAPHLANLEDREEQHRDDLAPARQRIEELSEEFDEILRRFTLPWLETAEVDRKTYLPRVNGRSLKELSSGGMKATTNVAYYLANLVMALRDPQILTPSFLMLDSIRKDYGAGEKDLARAELIYAYLRTLQDGRNIPGALAADFQLIVVDNDLPPNFEKAFNTITIDPDRPLIRFK